MQSQKTPIPPEKSTTLTLNCSKRKLQGSPHHDVVSDLCFSAASHGAAHGSLPGPTCAARPQLALVITGLREANGAREASGWAPLLAHTHTHTRFSFPQTRTAVEAESGSSLCAAQVWEHARIQCVCPDQFVKSQIRHFVRTSPRHHFFHKRNSAAGWEGAQRRTVSREAWEKRRQWQGAAPGRPHQA